MGKMITKHAALPLYVTRFQCIGADCEDTCCGGWNITVDKDTYERYGKAEPAELRQRLLDAVTRAPDDKKSLPIWGSIKLDPPAHRCTLLEGGMCGAQNAMGEEGLSDTCFTYPRSTWDLAGTTMQTLSLSCPEAARLALLAKDAFDLVESDVHVREMQLFRAKPYQGLTAEQMQEIRLFCLALMGTEDLELWQRLALLGLFCDDLTKLLETKIEKRGSTGGSAALVSQFIAVVQGGQLTQALSAMKPNHAAQAQVFAQLLQLQFKSASTPEQLRLQRAVVQGLGVDEKTGTLSPDVLVASYARGVTRLPEALASAPFFLEHAVRNDVIGDMFPFGSETPRRHFLQLISRFGIMRLMLAARCTGDALPEMKELVATVQAFARLFHHNKVFARAANAVLESAGWAQMDKLYSFLRA